MLQMFELSVKKHQYEIQSQYLVTPSQLQAPA